MKKYLRYIIMFTITLVLVLIIIFYNPNKKYLGVYKNNMTIFYDIVEDGYEWTYDLENKILKETDSSKNSWTFDAINDGDTVLIFYFKKIGSDDYKYKIKYILNIKKNTIYWTEGRAEGLLTYPNPK